MAGNKPGPETGTYRWPAERHARYQETLAAHRRHLAEIEDEVIRQFIARRPTQLTGDHRGELQSLLLSPETQTTRGKARGIVPAEDQDA